MESDLEVASANRPLVFEGAYDNNLATFRSLWHAQQRSPRRYTYLAALTHPQLVRQLHDLYLEAGCDVLQTHSWCYPFSDNAGGDEPGLDLIVENARVAARIARSAASAVQARDGRPRWVAGIVPAMSSFAMGSGDPECARRFSRSVAAGLLDGGADLLVVALPGGIADLQAHLAGTMEGCDAGAAARHKPTPILVSVEIGPIGLRSGDNVEQALSVAEQPDGVFSAGAYLTTGLAALPVAQFNPSLRRKPVHLFADAGYTTFDEDGSRGSMGPDEYGRAVAELAKRLGLRFVGGGWALTPAHIGALRRAVDADFGLL